MEQGSMYSTLSVGTVSEPPYLAVAERPHHWGQGLYHSTPSHKAQTCVFYPSSLPLRFTSTLYHKMIGRGAFLLLKWQYLLIFCLLISIFQNILISTYAYYIIYIFPKTSCNMLYKIPIIWNINLHWCNTEGIISQLWQKHPKTRHTVLISWTDM